MVNKKRIQRGVKGDVIMTEAEVLCTKINLLVERRELFVREINFKIAMLKEQPEGCSISTAFKCQPQKHRATNFGYKDEAIDS